MNIGAISGASPIMSSAGPAAAGKPAAAAAARTDSASFSPLQQLRNQRNNLAVRMESLTEQKRAIREQSASSGIDPTERIKRIDAQIEEISTQISKIDQQITEQAAKEAQQAQQAQARQDRQARTQPAKPEEVQAEQAANLAKLATDLDSVDTVNSVKSKVEGRARVVRSEIEQDSALSVGGPTPAKMQELGELKGKSMTLAETLANRLEDVGKKLAEEIQKSGKKDDDMEKDEGEEKDESLQAES